jgi:hypothetical protein
MLKGRIRSFDEAFQKYLDDLLNKASFSEARIKLETSIKEVTLSEGLVSEAKILMFKTSLRKTLQLNGGFDVDTLYEDGEKFGLIIQLLIDTDGCINPPEVRAWIKHVFEGEKRGKMKFNEFMDLLKEKCEQMDGVNTMRTLAKRYGFRKDTIQGQGFQQSKLKDGKPSFKPKVAPQPKNAADKTSEHKRKLNSPRAQDEPEKKSPCRLSYRY